MTHAIQVRDVEYRYGQRAALAGLDFDVAEGQVVALLGPNGGGKTTLFRLISTLIPMQQGTITVQGLDVQQQPGEVRRHIGVVFQSSSLDKKLTVRENLYHQGALYGLRGDLLRNRSAELLERLSLSDRAQDKVETLSGGLRRRVEIAKGLLHRPRVLLMDEPSTGLDPGARSDLWEYLQQLRDEHDVTVLLTTHLLEEADKADQVGILHQGRLVAEGSPNDLRSTIGGDTITIEAAEPEALAEDITQRLGQAATVVDGRVRLEQRDGHRQLAHLVESFPGRIDSITFSKPSLEDVFIARTGHRFDPMVDVASP
jgi:ABC-2 type transport system ATP-binding protein